MIALLFLALAVLASPFKTNGRLAAENAALRQQLTMLRRQVRGRVRLTNDDRLFFVQLYRWFPSGRPQIEAELRALIRRMSIENPLWERRAFTASCSSSALRSPSRRWPSTWSSDRGHQVRDGAPLCATTRRTSLPWTYSLSRALASTCSTLSSSSGWTEETSSGST